MKKRILSLLLCLCMAATFLPTTVWADDPADEETTGTNKVSVTIRDSTEQYETFAAAWDAATNADKNTGHGDAVITLLDSVTEENSSSFSLSSDYNIKVTLNIPQGMTLSLSRGFFVNPGNQSLTINGAPAGGQTGGGNGKLVVGDTGEPGAVRIGSGLSESDTLSTVTIQNCDINAAYGPAILGGDANVEIINSTITATPKVSDNNRTTAVSIQPNTDLTVALNVTNSTLTGQSGLWVEKGVTATVENSTITGTGEDTSDYGVKVNGGKLIVKGTSTIQSPIEGVDLVGGTLDFQSGTIKATAEDTSNMVAGVTVENNTSDDTLATPEAIIAGTIQSAGYGIRVAEGTVRIQNGADITSATEGVAVLSATDKTGKVIMTGGTIKAVNASGDGGIGFSICDGTAEISGSPKITGVTNGVYANANDGTVNLTISGGTFEATGTYGYGFRGDQGQAGKLTAKLSGGTYTGKSTAVSVNGTDGKDLSVKDLLESGYAYYREDGKIISTTEMESSPLWLDENTVTVKAGQPDAGKPRIVLVTSEAGSAFDLSVGKTYTADKPAYVQFAADGLAFSNVATNPDNWIIDTRAIGLTILGIEKVEKANETFVKINFMGTAAEGTITFTAKAAAFNDATEDSDPLTLKVGEDGPVIDVGPGLTRLDVAMRLYDFGKLAPGNINNLPSDCNSLTRDQKQAIAAVREAEWMVGNEEGFRPNAPVNRAEMAVAITKMMHFDVEYYENVLCEFTDVYDWACPYVTAMYANGIIELPADKLFKPNKLIDMGTLNTWLARIADPITSITRAAADTNSGITVRFENGTIYLSGALDFTNTSSYRKDILLSVRTEYDEIPITIYAYRDDNNRIIDVDTIFVAGNFLAIDVSGLTAKVTTSTPSNPGGSGSSGGGSSSGGSSSSDSSSTSTSTTKNPDGSTTTKTENKSTGTVTETTRNPDGSQTKVETKKDGTVTTTETDKAGNKTETVAKSDGSSVTKVEQKDGTTATVNTTAAGKVEAEVKLPAAAVNAAQQEGEAVSLPIPEVQATRSAVTAPTVTVNTGSSQPVKVEIPMTNPAPGAVAVLVKADGTEEIIKTSVPTADGVAVELPDGATVKIVDNSKDFADINSTSWAADAVDFVSARELFSGTAPNAFTPDAPMTRAMLVTVLARFDGEDTSGGSTWYQKGVDWAAANGVSDGSNPNSDVTREQLVTMLWRYSGSPAAGGNLAGYADAEQVSGYAQQAMRWAVDNGIISGFGNGQLAPQGQATRAQVAQILKNFIEKD